MKRVLICISVLIAFVLLILALINIFTYRIVSHDSLDDFWGLTPRELIASMESDEEINSIEEAGDLFFVLLRRETPGVYRILTNVFHSYYDDELERYYFYYYGYLAFEVKAYIDKGSSTMYYIKGIF